MTARFGGIVPYLFFDDVGSAIDWYQRVFGFEEISRWSAANGVLHNAEMRVGTTELWLDGSGRRKLNDERPHWIGVWVEDMDTVYDGVRAAGIECDLPVEREFGVRMLNVDDGMGHLWGFIKRIESAP